MTKKRFVQSPPQMHHLTEELTLLLQAALLRGEPALAAWRTWRPSADLDQLPPGGFGILPLLAYNLHQYGVNDELLSKCHGIQRRTWTQKQMRLQSIGAFLRSVQEADLTPILFGDLPLTLLYYPAQGLRAINQLHLWMPADQTIAMQKQITQCGWVISQTKEDRLQQLLQINRYLHFRRPGDDWSLYWHHLEADRWQNTRPLSINGVTVQSANVTDLLLAVCEQGVADFWRDGAIQWLADAFMLLHTTWDEIDWEHLQKLTQLRAITMRILAALHILQQSLGAPIPSPALQTLATHPIHFFEHLEAHVYMHFPKRIGKLFLLWPAYQRRNR